MEKEMTNPSSENLINDLRKERLFLDVLCREYTSVYCMDFRNATLEILKLDPVANAFRIFGNEPRKKLDCYSAIRIYGDNYVAEECREDFRRVMNPDNLREQLAREDHFTYRYSSKPNRASQSNFEVELRRIDDRFPDLAILAFKNIDELVKAENERFLRAMEQRKLEEEVREAQLANTAKTEFLQRMSHDIRTPLNGICGMLNIADHYKDDLEKQTECRRKVRESANLLLEMVNEVLDMSKLESGRIMLEEKEFNLYDTAEEVYDVIEKLAEERGISVTCTGKEVSHWDVIGSPVHVKRILMNIMSNAVKYNKDGGTIELAAREIPAQEEGMARMQFICRDTGVGMSEEFLQHIFEPFSLEQIGEKIRYSRTGLGMSITKKLVDAMKGTIEVESVKGEGSTFTVTIPFRIDRSGVPGKRKRGGKAADIAGLHVLLVEDNELNMEIAEFILQERHAVVTKAWNGKEAVDLFAGSRPGTFDVILMDIMMPVMDGYTAAERIRALNRKDAGTIPIIAMTANAFMEDKQRARSAGMNDHIAKPVSGEELVRLLSEYRDRS